MLAAAGVEEIGDQAAATLRHARLVAHELRNALLPVQHALAKIWTHPAMQSADLLEQRRRVDEGLARVHRFVDESLRLAPLTADDASPFSVIDSIDEARRTAPGGSMVLEAWPGSADPRCLGHRARFVLALVELLRNAVHVAGPEVRVHVIVDARSEDSVRIVVQDDGPGIASERRQNVFVNGISHRAGGTGHGLSFVRQVIQDEMNGTIGLAPSATGAAFEILLPTTTEERKRP